VAGQIKIESGCGGGGWWSSSSSCINIFSELISELPGGDVAITLHV